MKLSKQIGDSSIYMLHYKGKPPAPAVFELLSFKFYQKGGAFKKSSKSPGKNCLVYIKDNCKLSIHAKFYIDIGSTSGSMKC